MKWRTSDGIAKFRARLAKRGVALSGAALGCRLESEASAVVGAENAPSRHGDHESGADLHAGQWHRSTAYAFRFLA